MSSNSAAQSAMQPPSWASVNVASVAADLSGLSIPDCEEGALDDTALDAVIRVVDAPNEMLESLKAHYAKRQRCGPIGPELRDIVTAFVGLVTYVRERSTKHLSTWDHLLENGLGDFCEVTVEQNDFYMEHPDLILSALHMVDAMATCCASDSVTLPDYESPRMKQLQRIITTLCHAGYSHRELFRDDNVALKTYAPGASGNLRFRLQHMLNMAYSIYVAAGGASGFSMGSADATNHFRRMATLLWFHRGPEDGWQAESLLTVSLQILSDSSGPEVYEAFIDNEVVKLMGPFNFLAGLCGYLRHRDFPDHIFHERFLQGLGPVTALSHFWPHYSSSGFFAALRDMLDHYASLDDPDQWKILEAAVALLGFTTDQAPINDAASPLIRHFDVVELMSRSSILFARTATAEADDNTCGKIIESYARIAAALGLRTGKNTLKKAFRQATRREWYRTLKVLRELPLRDRRTSRKCTKLIAAWQGLGRALDLDETSEKADFEREMKKAAQMCAWPECEYHSKKPPHPTRVCVGCAEARYCSHLCQKKDWREGGHKHRCKRVKSEPHQSRTA